MRETEAERLRKIHNPSALVLCDCSTLSLTNLGSNGSSESSPGGWGGWEGPGGNRGNEAHTRSPDLLSL
jgi:hypothetical protein